MVFFISALFLSMIRYFLMAVFLAGIFSAMVFPLYERIKNLVNNRRAIASLATIFILVLVILLPLGMLIGIIMAQAIRISQSITPWIQRQIAEPTALSDLLAALPYTEHIVSYKEPILRKAGELVAGTTGFLINNLSSAAFGTINFLFLVFILLYSMFFFLMDGERLLARILYYLPLKDHEERRMLEKFTSVTRATLKGTIVIGLLQGGLAGAAFAVVGINGAAFWATIMTVLSIIPAVGSGLVWVPASIVLLVGGHYVKALGLVVFCGLLVGSLDNFLRPRLVGRDIMMHDLMILFGTLGGLAFFGILGFIVGPIISALFVTVWEIYGETFKDVLPEATTKRKESKKAIEESAGPDETDGIR